jgi:multisubunit Na+/H+ antiporter MnhE subunit
VAHQQALPPVSEQRALRSRLRFGLAWWAVLMGAWLLLVESFAVAELLVGVIASAAAASVAEAVRERGYVRFSPRAKWLTRAPGVAVQILIDCGTLLVALCRHVLGTRKVRSVLIRVPFRYGDDGSRAAARRALLNFGVSITPNTYVVDLDEETSTVLVHQLVPGPLDPLLEEQPDTADSASVLTEDRR